MPTILYVKLDDKRKRVIVGVEGDDNGVSTLDISASTYASVGSPERGACISERNLSDMIFEDEAYRALKKSISYLSASDKSRYELRSKLLAAGFSREACDLAIERCLDRGYIDEARQIERLVEREANYKLKGKYHIKRKLASKGYSSSDVERAIARLVEAGEIDFAANFEALAEKRGAFDEESRAILKYKFGYKM